MAQVSDVVQGTCSTVPRAHPTLRRGGCVRRCNYIIEVGSAVGSIRIVVWFGEMYQGEKGKVSGIRSNEGWMGKQKMYCENILAAITQARHAGRRRTMHGAISN